jgi:hypothetical protein
MMEREINAGYIITDRIAVGEFELVIGQSETAPDSFVTWQCRKGEHDFFWGHYCKGRLSAIEDYCKRVSDEARFQKEFRQEQHPGEDGVKPAEKKKQEMER